MSWYIEMLQEKEVQEKEEIKRVMEYKISRIMDLYDETETNAPLFCQLFCYPYWENTYTKVPVYNDLETIKELISNYGPYFDEIKKMEIENRIEYLIFSGLKEAFKINLQYLYENDLLDPVAMALYPEKLQITKFPLGNIRWYQIIGIQDIQDFSSMQNITMNIIKNTFLKSYESLDFIPNNLLFNKEILSNKFLSYAASFCHEIQVGVGEDGIIKIIRCKGNIP